jgi:hypothetical protein
VLHAPLVLMPSLAVIWGGWLTLVCYVSRPRTAEPPHDCNSTCEHTHGEPPDDLTLAA